MSCTLLVLSIWKYLISSNFKYRLLALWKLLWSEKYHLVTYSKEHLYHFNSSFNNLEYDDTWFDEGCSHVNDQQQQDTNIDYVQNLLNKVE